jgi:hypothetical protein
MLRHLQRQAIAIMSSLLALGLLAQFSNAGGHRRCARHSNGIPNYNYQTNEVRQRATVASHLVSKTDAAVAGYLKEKLFQPFEDSLVVGDCSLTQVRLLVDSDGNYLLSYRAANLAPSLDLAAPPTVEKTKADTKKAAAAKPIMPVRHHRFQITVRLFSVPENPEQPDRKRAGGIVLAQLTFDPFYVAAGDEKVISKDSNSADFQRHFAAATQAEFELEIDPPVTLPAKTTRP